VAILNNRHIDENKTLISNEQLGKDAQIFVNSVKTLDESKQLLEKRNELSHEKPKSLVTGNDNIQILRHGFLDIDNYNSYIDSKLKKTVEISIRNVSEKTIATALFEAIFYDANGAILDTVYHKECQLEPKTSRAFTVTSDKKTYNLIQNYEIVLLKTVTTDIEKIHLLRHEIINTKAGEERIAVVLKNISNIKTDFALIVYFYDENEEIICTKILEIIAMEPRSVRNFCFISNIPGECKVKKHIFDIGEMVENIAVDKKSVEVNI
jgi:hypothetical protein